MDEGERLKEILMNLAISLPMLIMGFTQLQSALGLPGLKAAIINIRGMETALQQIKIAKEAVAKTSSLEALAETRVAAARAAGDPSVIASREAVLTVAKKASAKATEEQAAAEAALKAARMGIASIAMIAVTAAVMIGSMAWSAYTESIKQAKEAEKEAMDTAASHAEEIRSNIKN